MDENTLTALVRVHQAGLYRFARYLGADAETAEDMVQETFLAAYEKDARLPADTGQCGAWLRGILRNLFFAHLRREKRAMLLANVEFLQRAETHWQEEALAADQDAAAYVAALRQCLQQASDRDRELLRLRYEHNLGLEEIGSQEVTLPQPGPAAVLALVQRGVAFYRQLPQRLY
ncbi:MAG: RNA polymerase sigma factor, partial [Planctomycetota bacterium]|nr:RNA polymerase sigma factor [Planctomycetota bacterium]